MTRDEILNMETGEQLDKLVAEKVMGWHIESTPEWSSPHWVDADGHYMAGIPIDGPWFEDDEDFNLLNWHPSGSILWSMEYVVEKIKELKHEIYMYVGSKNTVTIVDDNGEPGETHQITMLSNVVDESLSVAICKSALLAVMDE